jgi:two-component system, sensor histidine kinase
MTNSTPTPPSSFDADTDSEPLVQMPSGAKVHVLIADDNDTNRKVLAAMCDLFDCSSFLTKDGVEAVEAFFTMPFDVILMDIDMPRMDGIEATRTIRSGSEQGRRVPIVAVTASIDPSDLRTYADAGMNGVVPKPIEASRLLEAISTAVGTSLRRRPHTRPC